MKYNVDEHGKENTGSVSSGGRGYNAYRRWSEKALVKRPKERVNLIMLRGKAFLTEGTAIAKTLS